MFYDICGVEIIIEKLLLNGKTNEITCQTEIHELFDRTLQGSTHNHRFLITELCAISKQAPKGSNGETSKVRQIIIDQAKTLISGQKLTPSSMKSEVPKQEPSLPSRAISLVYCF